MKKAILIFTSIIAVLSLFSCSKDKSITNVDSFEMKIEKSTTMMDVNQEYEKEKKQNKQIQYPKEKISVVQIGSYIQDDLKTKEPIEWIVLEKRDNKVLLLSKKVIDRHKYNDELIDITWKDSLIRYWLNTDFYDEAFSDEEESLIMDTNIVNVDNNIFGTLGGENTNDVIFLLSIEEANKYFICGEAMATVDTVYARQGGVSSRKCWLRTPGEKQDKAAYYPFLINDFPKIDKHQLAGVDVFYNLGIRPAMWVKYKN